MYNIINYTLKHDITHLSSKMTTFHATGLVQGEQWRAPLAFTRNYILKRIRPKKSIFKKRIECPPRNFQYFQYFIAFVNLISLCGEDCMISQQNPNIHDFIKLYAVFQKLDYLICILMSFFTLAMSKIWAAVFVQCQAFLMKNDFLDSE